jgi:ureidoacrylate peracid hydrolase
VECAIRDAHSRDYACVLLEDCTAEPLGRGAGGYIGVPGAGNTSGGTNYDATLLLVQTLFGWVSNSESVVNALAGSPCKGHKARLVVPLCMRQDPV